MHQNHTLPINALSKKCLNHYSLDTGFGAILKTQCFFDGKGEVTDITWPSLNMINKESRHWHEFAGLVIISMGRETPIKEEFKENPVLSFHQLAEKHCLGLDA